MRSVVTPGVFIGLSYFSLLLQYLSRAKLILLYISDQKRSIAEFQGELNRPLVKVAPFTTAKLLFLVSYEAESITIVDLRRIKYQNFNLFD